MAAGLPLTTLRDPRACGGAPPRIYSASEMRQLAQQESNRRTAKLQEEARAGRGQATAVRSVCESRREGAAVSHPRHAAPSCPPSLPQRQSSRR